jgi:hypothetical protein
MRHLDDQVRLAHGEIVEVLEHVRPRHVDQLARIARVDEGDVEIGRSGDAPVDGLADIAEADEADAARAQGARA